MMESIETNKLMNPNDSIMSQKLGHNDSLAKIQDNNHIQSEKLDVAQRQAQLSNENLSKQKEASLPLVHTQTHEQVQDAHTQPHEQVQDVKNLYGKTK